MLFYLATYDVVTRGKCSSVSLVECKRIASERRFSIREGDYYKGSYFNYVRIDRGREDVVQSVWLRTGRVEDTCVHSCVRIMEMAVPMMRHEDNEEVTPTPQMNTFR